MTDTRPPSSSPPYIPPSSRAIPERPNTAQGCYIKELIPNSDGSGTKVRPFYLDPAPGANGIAHADIRRTIKWTAQIKEIRAAHHRVSAIVHSRGDDMSPCTRCRAGRGVFQGCIVARDAEGTMVGKGACANCIWTGKYSECSFRSPSEEQQTQKHGAQDDISRQDLKRPRLDSNAATSVTTTQVVSNHGIAAISTPIAPASTPDNQGVSLDSSMTRPKPASQQSALLGKFLASGSKPASQTASQTTTINNSAVSTPLVSAFTSARELESRPSTDRTVSSPAPPSARSATLSRFANHAYFPMPEHLKYEGLGELKRALTEAKTIYDAIQRRVDLFERDW